MRFPKSVAFLPNLVIQSNANLQIGEAQKANLEIGITSKMAKKRKTGGNRGIAIIKKANQLIEARYKFDIWETRFFLSVLSQIRRDDSELEVYRIWYRDIVKTFGLKSNQSYELLREAAKSLMQKSFYVNYEREGIEREVQYHILRKIDYMKEGEENKQVENQEYIDVTVENEMMPLLLQLQKNFTAYDLRNVKKLGTYPVRVYELLKQYESIGERTIYIDELKKMFELTTEYPRFPNFYQKVLQPAIRDINLHTDLTIHEIERVKEGKKVVALRFAIVKKDAEQVGRMWDDPKIVGRPIEIPFPEMPAERAAVASPNVAQELKDRLFLLFQPKVVNGFGVSPTVFMQELDKLFARYDEKTVEELLKQSVRVTERAAKEGRLKNPSGFFIEAVRQGFTDPVEEKEKKKMNTATRLALQSELEMLADERGVFINEMIREITKNDPKLSDDAMDLLRQNPMAKTYIRQKEDAMARPLDLEDFRQDRTLREWMKNSMVELRPDAFQKKIDEFSEKIAAVEAKLKAMG